MKTQIVKHIVQ